MTSTTQENTTQPARELLVVAAATAVTLWLGWHFDIATVLSAVSRRSHLGLDMADLGPGRLVLACGLGFMSLRRWNEANAQSRALSQAREVVTASDVRYRSLVDLSPAPIVLTDSTGRITFANDAAVQLLRAPSLADLSNKSFAPFIDPADLPLVMDRNARLLNGECLPPGEVRLRRTDGTGVVVQLLSSPSIVDGQRSVQTVLQDVTHMAEVADTLRRATIDTVEAMARLAETRDPYTSGHQERVARLAMLMAEHMGLPEETCQAVRIAGIVHDIGKINVPTEILSKPGRLTAAEFDLIKTHSERGYEILAPIEFPWPIAAIVRQHHERLDGSGYPHGTSDGDILIESRILAVADVVEAVASNRPYRPALGLDAAIKIIEEGRCTLYDPACVDACKAVAGQVITED